LFEVLTFYMQIKYFVRCLYKHGCIIHSHGTYIYSVVFCHEMVHDRLVCGLSIIKTEIRLTLMLYQEEGLYWSNYNLFEA
jgi:hypothetical protein